MLVQILYLGKVYLIRLHSSWTLKSPRTDWGIYLIFCLLLNISRNGNLILTFPSGCSHSDCLIVESWIFIWLKSILSPFFTVGIFWPLIIKSWIDRLPVDDFITENVTHLLIFTIKSEQLHNFVYRFKSYWLSNSKLMLTAMFSADCDQLF